MDDNDYVNIEIALQYSTVLYHTVPYCAVLYRTVSYCIILYHVYHTVTSLADTHLLIKLNAWSFRQKFAGGWWVGGDIAIIASSSRSRSDFEIELYIEICDRT